MARVLVTGGGGFIGSHVNAYLHEKGYETVVFDNFFRGSKDNVLAGEIFEGDLRNPRDLERVFSAYAFDAVMHFGGVIDVGESVSDPSLYYQTNVAGTANLLEAFRQANVSKLIFSSSAAVYGEPRFFPIDETHPKDPITPYGRSKWMAEQMLADMQNPYGGRYVSLRYFNAAGGDPFGKVKNNKLSDTNILPKTLRSIVAKKGKVSLYGTDYPTHDGTCIRDYVHIYDLAAAHILALEHLLDGGASVQFNLGSGKGYSLLELFKTIEKITGAELEIIEGPRRVGDPARLVADSGRAKRELGWKPQYEDLEQIVAHAWEALGAGRFVGTVA